MIFEDIEFPDVNMANRYIEYREMIVRKPCTVFGPRHLTRNFFQKIIFHVIRQHNIDDFALYIHTPHTLITDFFPVLWERHQQYMFENHHNSLPATINWTTFPKKIILEEGWNQYDLDYLERFKYIVVVDFLPDWEIDKREIALLERSVPDKIVSWFRILP